MIDKCTLEWLMVFVTWIAFHRHVWKFVGLTQAFGRRKRQRERESRGAVSFVSHNSWIFGLLNHM